MRIERCQVCGRRDRQSNPHGECREHAFTVEFPFDVCTQCADLLLSLFSEISEEFTSANGAVEDKYDNFVESLHQNGFSTSSRLDTPSTVVEEFLKSIHVGSKNDNR